MAMAANVSFADDTNINLWGINQTLTISSGGSVNGFTVYSDHISFDLLNGSSVTIVSPDKKTMTADPSTAGTVSCTASGGTSTITLTSTSTQTVTLTPGTDTCHPAAAETTSSGGGGGGGGGAAPAPTPAKPTTTTGSVTATASGGGKTSLTTDENTVAQADLPANAVTASTDIKIATESKTNVSVNQPAPSGKSMVGNYVYNFTATVGGTAVATFSKDITLTFTYTDSQIVGLNESSLKAYYWDGSQWVVLTSAVDKVNNKVTATTNHFTYFVLMGLPEGEEEPEEPTGMAKPEDYGLTEGDLVRAEGDWDIFIINQYGYKRLFLNPAIFEMYGHLGSWEDVKTITPDTRDAFVTSTHYRWVDDPDEKVYHQEVTGEDTATLHWINMTAEDFLAQGGTANGIFTINKSEFDWYPRGADKNSL